jgi:hypothetical protein
MLDNLVRIEEPGNAIVGLGSFPTLPYIKADGSVSFYTGASCAETSRAAGATKLLSHPVPTTEALDENGFACYASLHRSANSPDPLRLFLLI